MRPMEEKYFNKFDCTRAFSKVPIENSDQQSFDGKRNWEVTKMVLIPHDGEIIMGIRDRLGSRVPLRSSRMPLPNGENTEGRVR